ncbi:MAG: sulfate transporter CysZ [Gammaproteobacteria bacterium]|nr:sulfate transporter CysZ [Gammaproteobacteria bacterium]
MNNFISGFTYALSGFSWIVKPKIRRFVYIPLAINIVLFSLAIAMLAQFAQGWVVGWIGQKSDWWVIFQWSYDYIVPVLMFIMYVMLLFMSYFLFSSVANIIAAPFNSLLSRAVEQRLTGETITYSEIPLSKEIWITIKSELVKLLRFVVFAALILLLLVIPVLNILFPIAWFVFMAYALSLQYVDYPLANHGYFYADQRKLLKQCPMQRLGFGTAANLLVIVPVINFIAMPVCVCGATVWWNKSLKQKLLLDSQD